MLLRMVVAGLEAAEEVFATLDQQPQPRSRLLRSRSGLHITVARQVRHATSTHFQDSAPHSKKSFPAEALVTLAHVVHRLCSLPLPLQPLYCFLRQRSIQKELTRPSPVSHRRSFPCSSTLAAPQNKYRIATSHRLSHKVLALGAVLAFQSLLFGCSYRRFVAVRYLIKIFDRLFSILRKSLRKNARACTADRACHA